MNPELKWLGKKTVGELKIVHEGVVSLDETATVFDGLKLMYEKGLSSVALVNNKGWVTSNFSISDIKYLLHLDQLNLFHHTCAQFIQHIRMEKDKENDYKTTLPVFTITRDCPLEQAVGKLYATRTHRLWVVEICSIDIQTDSPRWIGRMKSFRAVIPLLTRSIKLSLI